MGLNPRYRQVTDFSEREELFIHASCLLLSFTCVNRLVSGSISDSSEVLPGGQ